MREEEQLEMSTQWVEEVTARETREGEDLVDRPLEESIELLKQMAESKRRQVARMRILEEGGYRVPNYGLPSVGSMAGEWMADEMDARLALAAIERTSEEEATRQFEEARWKVIQEELAMKERLSRCLEEGETRESRWRNMQEEAALKDRIRRDQERGEAGRRKREQWVEQEVERIAAGQGPGFGLTPQEERDLGGDRGHTRSHQEEEDLRNWISAEAGRQAREYEKHIKLIEEMQVEAANHLKLRREVWGKVKVREETERVVEEEEVWGTREDRELAEAREEAARVREGQWADRKRRRKVKKRSRSARVFQKNANVTFEYADQFSWWIL
jgi:hypothetical protein